MRPSHRWANKVSAPAHPGAGRLAQRFYIVFAEPTERAAQRSLATEAHLAYLAELEAAGNLFMAGPFVGEDGISTGGGMFVLRAASLAEAEKIAARDPYNAGGYRTFRVAPWRLDQGSFGISASFSTGGWRFV